MSQTKITGRAWVFGDDVDTDVLAPGLYMKGPVEELARHCLESLDPGFAPNVALGDAVVGGANFGVGSSREQAVQVLQILGIRALVATSFAGIFYRNALNFGLTTVVCAQAGRIRPGDRIAVDAGAGKVVNLSRDETYVCDALPDALLDMLRAGGLVAHLEKKLAGKTMKDGPT